MNNDLRKPGFEFIFSVGVVAALAIPQFLLAQDRKEERKEVKIVINDKDTTFNGKKLKDLAPKEKEYALAEISKMTNDGPAHIVRGKRRDNWGSDSVRYHLDIERYMKDNMNDIGRMPSMSFRSERGPERNQMDILRYRGNPMVIRNMAPRSRQTFEYSNVDKNGISTTVSYSVSEVRDDVAKEIAGISKSDMDLLDLTLTPQFSAGKTVLSFTLPAKTLADVQLTDSDGKVIWKEKAAGTNFSKSFTWGLNGVYYLVVKQAGKTAVKRIVKE
jgi:hypothetical protein